MTQDDADQLAAQYVGENSMCLSNVKAANPHCTDRTKNDDGVTPWEDNHGHSCQWYYDNVGLPGESNPPYGSTCDAFISGSFCCLCDGGIRLNHWEPRNAPPFAPSPPVPPPSAPPSPPPPKSPPPSPSPPPAPGMVRACLETRIPAPPRSLSPHARRPPPRAPVASPARHVRLTSCVCTVAQPGLSPECVGLSDVMDDHLCYYKKSLGWCTDRPSYMETNCASTCAGCPANVMRESSCEYYKDHYTCYSPRIFTQSWDGQLFQEGTMKEMCGRTCLDATCVDTDHGATSGLSYTGGNHITCSNIYKYLCDHSYVDDDDFTASTMCCVCGGGAIPSPSPPPAEGSATLGYTLDVDAHALQPGGEGSSMPPDQQANATAEAEAKASAEAKAAEAAAAAARNAEAARRRPHRLGQGGGEPGRGRRPQSSWKPARGARGGHSGYD